MPITKLPDEHGEEFRNLWEAAWELSHSRYHEFRDLAQQIRPDLSDADFDRGWQFCTVTQADFNASVAAFINIINQTF